MEILQEIGSYAGFAAVIGLAVLSALYFSQARDVKRLREWAGRAPERVPAPADPRRVVGQPVPRPPQPTAAATSPPPVPRPPGAQPGTTAQPAVAQSAAGAAPAVMKGPAAATPAAQATAGAMEAEDEDATSQTEGEDATSETEGEGLVEAPTGEAAEAAGPQELEDELDAPEDGADREPAEAAERPEAEDGDDEPSPLRQETDEWDPVESGEWRPEDEHSDLDSPVEGAALPPSRPAVRPPAPPQPYRPPPARSGTAPRTTLPARGRPGREPILPPYSQSRPGEPSRDEGGRRTAIAVGGVVLALAIAVFGVFQLTGGEDSDSPLRDESQSAPSADGDDAGATPVDPSSVTVAVLNGTLVPGLAAQMGDKLRSQDFEVGTVTNSYDQELAESVVLYAPGAEREAADVGRRLDISQRESIDPDSQELAGDASVVVVTGADLTQ